MKARIPTQRAHGRAQILVLAGAGLLAIVLPSAAAAEQAPRAAAMPVLYYVQGAKRASVEHVGGERYMLTMAGVADKLSAFSGSAAKPRKRRLATEAFVGDWKRLGFAKARPQAILLRANGVSRGGSVRVRLGQPRYRPRAKTIRYPVRIAPDERAARRFGRARLVIDGHAEVGDGCVLKPFADCSGAFLAGRNLSGRDLSGANFHGADLSYADLSNTSLSDANLSNANLHLANLSRAILNHANLTDADLSDANLSNANLFGVKFCRTRMPDGSTNSSGCPAAPLTDAAEVAMINP